MVIEMITGIFGLPGAGKSCFLAYLAQKAIKHEPLFVGHRPFWTVPLGECEHYERVFCNFPMIGAYKLNYEHLGMFDFSRSLVLIDEIASLANSRNWKGFGSEKVEFFTQHRHDYIDVIYCSQSYKNMDLTIRELTGQYMYIRKDGEYTLVTPIEKKIRVEPSMDDSYSLRARLCGTRIKRKKYYHLFDSYVSKELPENPAESW